VTTPHDIIRLREHFARIALAAGRAIMAVYDGHIAVADKSDGSPTTAADSAAEEIILAELAKVLPGVPVLAEESASAGLPSLGDVFVAVDPLDGTREFINRNGEFTVNIALIERGVPTAGVVYAPALGRLWLGGAGEAFTLAVPSLDAAFEPGALRPIRTRPAPAEGLVAVASRSHLDENTAAFLERLPIAARRSTGSSLKFCLVAEGEADVYPRFGPTMEWDTAAGHAVVAAAGGRVVTPEGEPFVYGKTGSGYRNGSFVVWGR
jgi:3'(2'), 5'-bisphosphate nucleotidase